jgi:hypothetical protein
MVKRDDVFFESQATGQVDPTLVANDLARRDGKPVM